MRTHFIKTIFAEFKCPNCGMEWNMEDIDVEPEDEQATFTMDYCTACDPAGENQIKSMYYSIVVNNNDIWEVLRL